MQVRGLKACFVNFMITLYLYFLLGGFLSPICSFLIFSYVPSIINNTFQTLFIYLPVMRAISSASHPYLYLIIFNNGFDD